MTKTKHRPVTVWITGDQCTHLNSALKNCEKDKTTVLMIESVKRGNFKPYHKRKLVLIYSVMRHFAEELQELGWHVDYRAEHPDFANAVGEHLQEYKPQTVRMMEQSEFGAAERLKKMLQGTPCEITEHTQFVSSKEDFERLHATPESRVTMERFYRDMRKKTGILVDGNEPVGGFWNFDKENRSAPHANMQFRKQPTFPSDKVTKSVIDMVNKHFADHPGEVTHESWDWAVTRADALVAAEEFLNNGLDDFGTYQDAMIAGQPFMNHSILSPYINVGLLHPLELCRAAEERYLQKKAALHSVEGYIRQLIGWREYVWRVYWRLMPEFALRNHLQANNPVPKFYWTGQTDMKCMNEALTHTLTYAYAHHILRLMILGNFSLLSAQSPQAVNDWFWAMFADGYEWVMVPNVIGMALHADGGYVGTKPYAASANYINKMSDYCKKCKYNPKKVIGTDACPFNSLYWDFLARNERTFRNNHRMQMMLKNLDNKLPGEIEEIRAQAKKYIDAMNEGRPI